MTKRNKTTKDNSGVIISTDEYTQTHGKAPTPAQVGTWTFQTPAGKQPWQWIETKYADAVSELKEFSKTNVGRGVYTLLP